MMNKILTFLRDDEGLTVVEYAIAGGLIGGGCIAAFTLLGDEVFRIINAIGVALGVVVI